MRLIPWTRHRGSEHFVFCESGLFHSLLSATVLTNCKCVEDIERFLNPLIGNQFRKQENSFEQLDQDRLGISSYCALTRQKKCIPILQRMFGVQYTTNVNILANSAQQRN